MITSSEILIKKNTIYWRS